ncbi:forkhead box protein P3 [Spea bombifrons]|uniref:forkhead box protein P3 n=1 Tax=Spea bombifrons TaxID=233779 RepID=UPI00234A40C0|nr:forkhead box protein P3 [Spea bombifrons]
MPRPQSNTSVLDPSAKNDPHCDEKGKEPSSSWNQRSDRVFTQQQPPNPYAAVAPSSSISSSSQLRALLHDSKQAVVIHPLSRGPVSRSPVIRLSPVSSSAILNLQPARLLPVIGKQKQQLPVMHGFNLTSLGWVQEQTCLNKPGEVTSGKKSLASGSRHHPPSQDVESRHKKCPGEEKSEESTEVISSLSYGGVCKFADCEKIFEDHGLFLRHLHSDHNLSDKSTMECLIQTEVVHSLEEQLAVEKQRLHEMQRLMTDKLNAQAVHVPKQKEHNLILHRPRVSAWSGLNVSVPVGKEFPDSILAVRRHLWEGSSINIFQDMTNCTEYYKVNNVRPPFTYASLIRWAILESPQKQLALNEIYHWFTRMFAFFRSNKITWKNAVRHNLSLHKCFVRVENIRGAVWMVDELEFQRKRGARSSR